MKFSYKASNLLGTIYRKGNIVFTPDGNSLISPVGNKLTIYNLKSHKVQTLFLESRYNYSAIALSSSGTLLVAVNENGEGHFISMLTCNIIHRHKFRTQVGCIVFSPDDKHFAVTLENEVLVYRAPGNIQEQVFACAVVRKISAGYEQITCLEWSSDSRFIAVGSQDNSTRVFALFYVKNFRPYVLGGHTDNIVACCFEDKSLDINTVSKNGQLCIWKCSFSLLELANDVSELLIAKRKKTSEDSEDDVEEKCEENLSGDYIYRNATNNTDKTDVVEHKNPHPFFYKKTVRKYLADEQRKDNPSAIVTATNYNRITKMFVVAFSTGAFYLYDLPDVNLIHSLKISDYPISTIVFNKTGDWLGLASIQLGQLLVWEWQSEQYILKQQGHTNDISCISYSPDGQYIATGGEDAKVKLWNVRNGSCFVTFKDHTAGITDIQFSRNKKFLISSSLDGTVRAFDIVRYRNFRTLTASDIVQFTCIAIDYSCELVVAGCQDVFEVYMWSLKLGKLLEIISGHQGPISSLAFSPTPTSSCLVTGSWDNTIKVWNCLETTTQHETFDLFSDVIAIAFNPGGEQISVASLNGKITIVDLKTMTQINTIEGQNDLFSGRSDTDVVTAKKNQQEKCFTALEYSPDGEYILAAGRSPVVCLYHVKQATLMKKFAITANHSLSGLEEFMNRRHITEFGNMNLLEKREVHEGNNVVLTLPGVQKCDMSARNYKLEFQVTDVKFSPTAQAFAVACTEGLLIYSLDKSTVFDPFNLSLEITPKAVCDALQQKQFYQSLVMSLKLNEDELIVKVLESIPYEQIIFTCSMLPDELMRPLLKTLSRELHVTSHLEFYLQWCSCLLSSHGNKDNTVDHQSLLALHESVARKYETLHKMCDFNKYTMEVLLKAIQ